MVADVQRAARLDPESLERESERRRIRLLDADLGRADDRVEPRRQPVLGEVLVDPVVPVRDDREREPDRPQAGERLDDAGDRLEAERAASPASR
jgi:hypothetical protein